MRFFAQGGVVERRFEQRKREIEQDAQIDKKAFGGSVRRLQQFGQAFFAHFRRSETRQNARFFLEAQVGRWR